MNRKTFGTIVATFGFVLLVLYFIVAYKITRSGVSVQNDSSLFGSSKETTNVRTSSSSESEAEQEATPQEIPIQEIEPTQPAREKLPSFFQVLDVPVLAYTIQSESRSFLDSRMTTKEILSPEGETITVEEAEDFVQEYNLHLVSSVGKGDGSILATTIEPGLPTIQKTDSVIARSDKAFISENASTVAYQYTQDDSKIITFLGSLVSIFDSIECPRDTQTPIKAGDVGQVVEGVQSILSDDPFIFETLEQEFTPGTFDEAMTEAIKKFQRAYNIEDSGNVLEETRIQLASSCLDQKISEVREQREESGLIGTHSVEGIALPSTVFDIALVGESDYFFLTRESNETAGVYVKNEVEEILFQSPLRELSISPTDKQSFVIHTKPSNGILGVAWEASELEGQKRIMGSSGLLIKKLQESFLYTSESSLLISGSETETTLPFFTLPEKCTSTVDESWVVCATPSVVPEGLPDTWFRNEASLAGSITAYEPASKETLTFPLLGEMDAIDLQISSDDVYVFMRDKKTNLLYAQEINL